MTGLAPSSIIVLMKTASPWQFTLAWTLPVAVGVAAGWSPWAAWAVVFGFQVATAGLERVPGLRHSPAPAQAGRGFRFVLHVHVLLQGSLLAWGCAIAASGQHSVAAVIALGLGVGGVTGAQGITFAHELGHSRSRLDRALAWALMGSVLYVHFMVEHYRGHHVRAATFDDPASARRGESLWRFLPRTLLGSLLSAWRLESAQLARLQRGWESSPLLWASAGQLLGLALLLTWLGPLALLFWIVQAAYAVFLLEAINYIEHYGLQRQATGGRTEAFGMQHAWNADPVVTNRFIANLQRHSDHHMHAWKPYQTLQALPGPQLPSGYAGCLFLASVPPLWFRAMHPRLASPSPGTRSELPS